jgi:tetratricopeptide (TPR) repeat protein
MDSERMNEDTSGTKELIEEMVSFDPQCSGTGLDQKIALTEAISSSRIRDSQSLSSGNNPNRAIFDVLDKSFESLLSSPLLPFPSSSCGSENDPLMVLRTKEIIVRILRLCFASFAVTFQHKSPSPGTMITNDSATFESGLKADATDDPKRLSITSLSTVSSISTAGKDNDTNTKATSSLHDSTGSTIAAGTKNTPMAVPCEILFLLWEMLISPSSIETTPDERKILQDYLSNTAGSDQQQKHPSTVSELAMHILLSLGLIELVEETMAASPCLRISHELNQAYGIHLSQTKLIISPSATVTDPKSAVVRWNTILAQNLQRIYQRQSITDVLSSAIDLYAIERLPYHLMMSGSYREASCMLTQEIFVKKRLLSLGFTHGTKVHHHDLYRYFLWATESSTMGLMNTSGNTSLIMVSQITINTYSQISKCLFREHEMLELMYDNTFGHTNGTKEGNEHDRPWLQIGEAFHLLGTYYTALISTRGNKKHTEEEHIVNISSMDPSLLGSLQDEEMKHYQVALKIRQLYYGENHRSVGDSYLAIGMAYQTRGDAYKAMSYYNHATDTYKVCLGSNSLQYAKVLFFSGVIYLESRDLETALECFEECLHIRRNSSNQKRINSSTNNNDNNSEDNAETLHFIGKVYQEMGNTKEAMRYFKASLWVKENLYGAENLDVAASYYDIGNILRSKRDCESAIWFYQKALNCRKKVLGEDHELVGETTSQLARAHEELGDTTNAIICFNEAIRIGELKINSSPISLLGLYDEAMPLLVSQYGPKDEIIATSLQAMASCYEKLTQLDQAVNLYEEALRLRQEAEDDSNTATIFCRLGLIKAKKKQYAEALSYFEEALALRKLQMDYMDVANILHNIGNTLVKMKRIEEAKIAFAEALSIKKVRLGRDHISVGKTLHNMGNIHDQLGDVKNSIICYETALRIRRKNQIPENALDLSFTLHNLAQVYLKVDDSANSERALELFSEALSIRKKKFGDVHELVGDTVFSIGKVYDLYGDDQALQYFNEAKKIYEATLGTTHSKVADVYDFIGSIFDARTEYSSAKDHYEKSLKIKKATLGEESMPYAETLYHLGSLYAKTGDDDKVLMYYKDALRVMKLHVGKNDLRVGIILNDVGIIQARRGHHAIALKCLEEAHRIRVVLRGNSHEDIADTLFNIGNVYQDLCDYGSALKYFKDSLDMYKSISGVDSLDVGNALHQIGECCRMKNNFELALKYYKDALEVRTLRLGIDDLDVSATLNGLGLMQHEAGDFESALQSYDEAIRIRRLTLGDDHLLVAESIFNKGALLTLCKRNDEAIDCYVECLGIFQQHGSFKNLAKALAGLGSIYEEGGNIELAIAKFEEALAIRIDNHDQDHESIGELLLNIGFCYLSVGQHEKATSSLEEALKMFKTSSEKENIDMITKTIDAIGRVYDAQSKHDDALICYRESLRLRLQNLGKHHLTIADSFDLMASSYQAKSELNDAIRCIKQALDIRRENLGERNIEVGNTLFGMGVALCEAGKYSESVLYYKQALSVREQCLGESSIEVAKTLHNIGSVLALKRDYADALTNWRNAVSIYQENGMSDDDDMVKCALGNISMAERLLLDAGPDTGMM